ncbi:PLP-dependent aminotransferase family protein [Saccharothrix sp. S26]|uniref:aminotransferase-like domain-containing protein n=1 Tax=Saccharothrix sp. S26 TaxID=2907215 RepID=UPI001F34821D|nr:PLP-dependent aminotransferase family protein [Saccharothrix sp. S26]MCE6999046.1 PLP-dependent aminotransferase family protein [Saccharothrix sp. S26]
MSWIQWAVRPPSYKPVVDEFAAAIRRGELTPGTRLPTHRDLARERHIALATATRVYAELAALGLVVGERGRGTFVRDQSGFAGLTASRDLPVPRIADLSFAQPPADEPPDHLRRALRDLSTSGDLASLTRQQPPGGRRHERAAVATHLLDRGIDTAPANVVLTCGAQHALDTALRATTRPGDVLAADALTYPGLKLLAAAHHLELAPVPVTATGPDLDALDRLCRTRRVRAVYTIPTLHNPLGWVLDRATRERLVGLAREHDLLIVEDGTYAFLDPAAPSPVHALAPERTCYVSSLSKNLAGGLRFGFAVVPDGLVPAFTTSLRSSTWGVAGLVSALATRWLADGTVARLEQRLRADARARQAIARTALAGLDTAAHPASCFTWLRLAPHLRADRVAAALARVGVLVSTGDAFATDRHPPQALRLALTGPAMDDLAPVLARLRETLDAFPP